MLHYRTSNGNTAMFDIMTEVQGCVCDTCVFPVLVPSHHRLHHEENDDQSSKLASDGNIIG